MDDYQTGEAVVKYTVGGFVRIEVWQLGREGKQEVRKERFFFLSWGFFDRGRVYCFAT